MPPSLAQQRQRFAFVEPSQVETLEFDEPPTWKDGPRTHRERYNWAKWGFWQLRPQQRDRLVRNLGWLHLSTHFSGFDGPVLIFVAIVFAINNILPTPIKMIRPLHAAELNHSRRSMLIHFEPWARSQHIYGDMLDRLPPHIRQMVDETMPDPSLPPDVRSAAYRKISTELEKFYTGPSAHTDCQNSECLIHKRNCKLYTTVQPLDLDTDGSDRESGDVAPVIRMNIAGPECSDFTNMGAQKHESGPSMVSQSCYFAERQFQREHLICTENNLSWTISPLAAKLPTHRALTCELKAAWSGDKVHRDRRASTLIDNGHLALVEDPSQFLVQMGRKPLMDLSEYMNASLDTQQAEYEYWLTQRVHPVEMDTSDEMDWSRLRTPVEVERTDHYAAREYARQQLGLSFAARFHLFDMDHNPLKRARTEVGCPLDPSLMSLISHGMIWIPSLGRWMLACEWCSAHGVPFRGLVESSGAPVNFHDHEIGLDFSMLMGKQVVSPMDVKRAVGLGWHLPSQGLWLMWLLGSLELTSLVCRVEPFFRTSISIDDDDDDEDNATTISNQVATNSLHASDDVLSLFIVVD